jgi:hypothetical protein
MYYPNNGSAEALSTIGGVKSKNGNLSNLWNSNNYSCGIHFSRYWCKSIIRENEPQLCDHT